MWPALPEWLYGKTVYILTKIGDNYIDNTVDNTRISDRNHETFQGGSIVHANFSPAIFVPAQLS